MENQNKPQQTSTAMGVFWGLVLFFVVLPMGTCVACTTCAATGTAINQNQKQAR